MTRYHQRAGLQISTELLEFVEHEVAPGTGIESDALWRGYASILAELSPVNSGLLKRRDEIQSAIDAWHREHRGQQVDLAAYRAFLFSIGYIVPEGPQFTIDTANVDPEIAKIAGPQLVVPVMNARFALNAANARWGSLYDALYGTDAIERGGNLTPSAEYNTSRGAEVVRRAADFLDLAIPLVEASHRSVVEYRAEGGALTVVLNDDRQTTLTYPEQWMGFSRNNSTLRLLFSHNGLHLELLIDRKHSIGRHSASGLADVVLESALTTIQDCEDSVAAVDASDKVAVYRNWLGLMKGDLTESVEKNGQRFTRSLVQDRHYTTPSGGTLVVPGRSLLLVRNVGHLMTTDAVLDAQGSETPEGMLDALITSFCAMHDLQKAEGPRNSRSGSIYIVKPKMHGPDEVSLTNTLFDRVEDVLGLARHTIKVGIMDEERRTSVNLRECIRAVQHRVVFINTGFLDRTGDEIHTSMAAGPMLPKGDIKSTAWLSAYEDNNVEQGLQSGFRGRAQIGKGMWARPDDMAAMINAKLDHPKSGASTAWVPSPTAATLHAMHYHMIDVGTQQRQLEERAVASLDDILTPPLLNGRNLSDHEVVRELENNAQGILGYVVRWIDQGIGCSKVPDIDDVALMEDRATLRISSQHIANWLQHGLLNEVQVRAAFERMAVVVDHQNETDSSYRPMASNLDRNLAFQAALALVMEGASQPNGYTEPVLHRFRRLAKAETRT